MQGACWRDSGCLRDGRRRDPRYNPGLLCVCGVLRPPKSLASDVEEVFMSIAHSEIPSEAAHPAGSRPQQPKRSETPPIWDLNRFVEHCE